MAACVKQGCNGAGREYQPGDWCYPLVLCTDHAPESHPCEGCGYRSVSHPGEWCFQCLDKGEVYA